MLQLLFSSLVWEGWLRLGMPSPLTVTAPDDGVYAAQTENSKEYRPLHKQTCLDCVVFLVIRHHMTSFMVLLSALSV